MDRSSENARDRVLVEQARAGDLGAFNQLVELHQDYLFAMTVRVVRDRDTAGDAVQEAFFSAYRNLASFSGPSFRAWLTRIAINAARDILRKQKRRPSEPYPEWEDDSWQPPAPATERPEQVSLRNQQRAAIARAMATITVDQRMAIVLYDVAGLRLRRDRCHDRGQRRHRQVAHPSRATGTAGEARPGHGTVPWLGASNERHVTPAFLSCCARP